MASPNHTIHCMSHEQSHKLISMKIFVSSVIVILVVGVLVPRAAASSISVPLEYWGYHFIERLQARGALRSYLSSIRPYTRDEMADMIVHVSVLLKEGKISLSKVEKDEFALMKSEFAPELKKRGMTDVSENKHLLDWSKGHKKFVAQIGCTQTGTLKRGTEDYNSYQVMPKLVLWGNLDHSAFYNRIKVNYKRTDEPLPLWDPYLDPTRSNWELVSDAYVILKFPGVNVEMGKDELLWGPGYHGVVGLAGKNPTFDAIKIPAKVWKLKFVSILGFLRDDLTRQSINEITEKYLAAHRIEITPFPGLTIGWQEAYIYADTLNLEIMNPIMPCLPGFMPVMKEDQAVGVNIGMVDLR